MDNTFRLMKSQKDDIFTILVEFALEPTDFLWDIKSSVNKRDTNIDTITHIESRYFYHFEVYQQSGGYANFAIFSPGEEKQVDYQFTGSWEFQTIYFKQWLGYLKREISAPGFWDNIYSGTVLENSAISIKTEETQFTEIEAKNIGNILNNVIKEMRILGEKGEINDKQLSYGIQQIEYLKDQVIKMNKRQWLHTTIGVLVTLGSK